MSDLLRKFTSDMVCHAVAGRSFRVEGRDRVFQDLIDEGMALLAGFNLEISYPGLAKAAVLECDLGQHQRLRARPPAPTNSAGAWRGWKPDCHIWKQFIHIYIKFFTRQGHLDPNQVKITSCFSIIYPNFDYRWHLKALAERLRDGWDRILDKLIDEHASEKARAPAAHHEDGGDNDQECDFVQVLLSVEEEYGLTRDGIKGILVDCHVESFEVPAGTTALVNVWAIGRDPMVWDAAEEFMPERFIRNGEVKGVDFRGKDFQLLPFGSGRRMCPGMNFALASIEIMLANIVYHFDRELPKGVDKIDMTEVSGLTSNHPRWRSVGSGATALGGGAPIEVNYARSSKEAEDVSKEAMDKWGTIDVLVNNAGMFP
ncbi:hypothetical protein SETIT_7G065000v2 [Setaria italica]|uniref:Uncharacterized protein n=1 Tax=Setaria italica TaxID=4555 RepID=A0A368RSQ2_SETIT|nr:hypothetical protein SETIT_7G065000v2 [Setaria italica]